MIKDRHQQVHRATLITALTHVLLGFAKVIFGVLGHSQALVADGIHSFADLFTDALVIIASRLGSQAADDDHPYGHARIETIVAVALSMILAVVGMGILFEAGMALFVWPPSTPPRSIVLMVALLSVIANEALFRYLKIRADQVNSALLRTNAWHCRSDAASSFVVLLGAGAAYLGFHYCDAVAALIVGCLIIKMAWDLGWPCIRELVDTGIAPDRLAEMTEIITQTPGVEALHQLRTRSMAGDIYVDVHVLVEPRLSVSEGHYIGELVCTRLLKLSTAVKDVTVHVDPEDDEVYPLSQQLPARKILLEKLKENWHTYPTFKKIQAYHLHYLAGFIDLEIDLPFGCVPETEIADLVRQYNEITKHLTIIKSVSVHFVAN